MRLSTLLFATRRDDPAEADMASHRLLVRAGYVRRLGAGLYTVLPLGFAVHRRVEQVIPACPDDHGVFCQGSARIGLKCVRNAMIAVVPGAVLVGLGGCWVPPAQRQRRATSPRT